MEWGRGLTRQNGAAAGLAPPSVQIWLDPVESGLRRLWADTGLVNQRKQARYLISRVPGVRSARLCANTLVRKREHSPEEMQPTAAVMRYRSAADYNAAPSPGQQRPLTIPRDQGVEKPGLAQEMWMDFS